MSEVMLRLGDFTFSVDTAAYQSFRRQTEYRWASLDRIGNSTAYQAMGQGKDSIILEGVIYPHYKGGLQQIEQMRTIAKQLQPLDMVDGLGYYYGQFVIIRIEEKKSIFFKNSAPLKQQFTLELAAYGNLQDG
jgi:phage protein U